MTLLPESLCSRSATGSVYRTACNVIGRSIKPIILSTHDVTVISTSPPYWRGRVLQSVM